MEKGYDFRLCHTTKMVDGIKTVDVCHTAYHVDMKLYTPAAPPGSTTECSVISDLTEEKIFHQVIYCLRLMGIL